MKLKKIWKKIRWLVWLVVIVIIVDAITVFGFALAKPNVQKADAIIVLGAAINSEVSTERSLEGLRLYQAGKAKEIILSGGRINSTDISEAQYMQKVIAKNAVLLPKIVLEQNSHNTYENLKYSKILAPNAQSVIIVTDKYHLARSVLLAHNYFKEVYWSSPSESYYSKEDLVRYYLREMVAMIAYIPRFVVK